MAAVRWSMATLVEEAGTTGGTGLASRPNRGLDSPVTQKKKWKIPSVLCCTQIQSAMVLVVTTAYRQVLLVE